MKTFPVIKDLVTDVSCNYEVDKKIPPFKPQAGRAGRQVADAAGGHRPGAGVPQVHRVLPLPERLPRPPRPRRRTRRTSPARASSSACAALEMHPLDTDDRRELLKQKLGLGMCNITKCCTEVCPENIKITDNAIIPLKERVVDQFYDPLRWAWRKVTGGGSDSR